MIIVNKHDQRYKFEFIIDKGATMIIQLDRPQPTPPIYFTAYVWAQWTKSKTTKSRSEKFLMRLQNEKPTTKWFKSKMHWVY